MKYEFERSELGTLLLHYLQNNKVCQDQMKTGTYVLDFMRRYLDPEMRRKQELNKQK